MASAILAAQASKGVPKQILRQSLFFAYCPDADGVLQRRLEVRPAHFERVKGEKEDGSFLLMYPVFGIGYLPSSGSSLFTHPSLPPSTQPMAGSVMIFRQPSLEDMWKRIKEDVYWTEGIWDKDKVVIHQLLDHPEYVDMGS